MSSEFVDFRHINPYAGSQSRAFEELGFQLLTAGIDRDSWKVTRTGDPDAGLDWYVTDDKGEIHGWQAKYIFDISSLLTNMTKSLQTVVAKRPEVKKLTFVIPWNLPDGRSSKGKSARQKFIERVEYWQKNMDGAENIEFDLFGESELVSLLARPEHCGRLLFFLGQQILSKESLRQMHTRASDIAGHRYRPELHIDIPIQKEIEILGLGGDFFEELNSHFELLCKKLNQQLSASSEFEAICEQVVISCRAIINEGIGWVEDVKVIPERLDILRSSVSEASETISDAILKEVEKLRQVEKSEVSCDSSTVRDVERSTIYRLRRIADTVNRLQSMLSSSSDLIGGRPYFLSGEAGAGKTHLLLDACDRALNEDRPAAVLFGEQFGTGDDLWSQLARGLGLKPDLSQSELLSIIDACGASSGKRFLLAIDALNETRPISFWTNNLIHLVSALEEYPHVALVVSVRTTYIEQIDPDKRRTVDFILRCHPGFAGRELEAAQLYFRHYGLEVPRHPLLIPEFTNPLFLQLYCESYQDSPGAQHEYESRIAVFDRLIDSCTAKVARQLTETGSSTEISFIKVDTKSVINSVLDAMGDRGDDRLTLQDSRDATSSSVVSQERVDILLDRLEAEGIFNTGEMWISGSWQLGLRLTFQAFGDYLILKRRLDRCASTTPISKDGAFASWLLKASWGIQEAAAVILPELYRVELRDYLESAVREISDDTRKVEQRCDYFDVLTLNTLAYRTAGSITSRTVDAVNRNRQHSETYLENFYSKMCMVAALPNHPLNSLYIHNHLASMSMAERDATFGIAVYDALDQSGPYYRLAVWAREGPYHNYDEHVVELAAIPLIWLLSSPNRFMRDWLTKVLVCLFVGHVESLSVLIKRFANINDIYIRERLAAIVYGVLMRSQSSFDRDSLRKLVIKTCTYYLERPIANALVLDHLEGITEYSLTHKIVCPDEIPNHKDPYGLPIPDHPWSKEYIDENYGYGSGEGKDKYPYGAIYGSLFGLADFGRYIVDCCFLGFTNLRRTEPEPLERSIDYPTEGARRWIFMKVIKYGWTPERFENFERGQTYSLFTTKAERFGKKYQWMAYFELLARVREHFHPQPSSATDAETEFQGLWDTFDRDIDPSVPPIDSFKELQERQREDTTTFSPSEIVVPLEGLADQALDRYLDSAADDPLQDYDSLPRAATVVEVLDEAGEPWLLLDAYNRDQVDDPALEFGMSIDQISIVSVWLVPEKKAQSAAQVLLDNGPYLDGPSDMWDRNGHIDCCYLGEVGWRSQGCYHRRADFIEVADEQGIIHHYLPVAEEYTWESGRFDASITSNTRLYTPSAWLISMGQLSWDGNLSWLDGEKQIVVTYVGKHGFDESHDLIFRKSWLKKVLIDHNLELLVRCWSDRRDFRIQAPIRSLWSSSIALFDQSVTLRLDGRVNRPLVEPN